MSEHRNHIVAGTAPTILQHHFTKVHSLSDMTYKPIELVSLENIKERETFWIKTMNSMFPYGMNVELNAHSIPNIIWDIKYHNKCAYKLFPKIDTTRSKRGGNTSGFWKIPRNPDVCDLVDVDFETIYAELNALWDSGKYLKPLRDRISHLSSSNCHKIWLNCIKHIQSIVTFEQVNTELHKLLLIKDLCYHFANRMESYTEKKAAVKHTLICDFKNKLIDEVKLDQILKSKDVVRCFPLHLFDVDNDNKK